MQFWLFTFHLNKTKWIEVERIKCIGDQIPKRKKTNAKKTPTDCKHLACIVCEEFQRVINPYYVFQPTLE